MNSEEFWQILHNVPEAKPVFWRLYYDDQGRPITYSMEHLPGTYIEITAEMFAQAPLNIRVINGKIVELKKSWQKYQPSDTGTPCCPDNVAIVVDQTQPHQRWNLQTHETN